MPRAFLSISTAALLSASLLLHAQAPAQPTAAKAKQDLPKPGSLTLTLLDSRTKQPVKNAAVDLTGFGANLPNGYAASRPTKHNASSNSEGKAVFTGLPPASYSVSHVQGRGYDFWSHLTSSGKRHQVSEGGSTNATFLVDALGVVEGKVTDDAGDPVEGADVVLLEDEVRAGTRFSIAIKRTSTDDRGQYRIADVRPKRYLLRASFATARRPGFAPVYYPAAGSPLAALRILVTPSSVQTMDLRFRPPSNTFHLRGTAVGLPSPQPGRSISLVVDSCPPGRREASAFRVAASVQRGARQQPLPTGSFDVANLLPGTYCVTLEDRGRPDTAATVLAYSEVTIVDQDINDLRFTASLPKTLVVTVTAEQDYLGKSYLALTPLGGPVEAYPLRNSIRIDAATGTARIEGLLPIDYKLQDSICGGVMWCFVRSMKLNGQDVAGTTISGAVGGEVSIHLGYRDTPLRAAIDFGSQKPLQDMRVTIAPDGPLSSRDDLISTHLADANGEALWSLAPGDYLLYAWEQFDYELTKLPEFLARFKGTPVTVKAGGQAPFKVRIITAKETDGVLATF